MVSFCAVGSDNGDRHGYVMVLVVDSCPYWPFRTPESLLPNQLSSPGIAVLLLAPIGAGWLPVGVTSSGSTLLKLFPAPPLWHPGQKAPALTMNACLTQLLLGLTRAHQCRAPV